MASKASAVWTGSLKEGKGTISTATGVLKDANYSFATRFEGADSGTTPEELIAAAHASCFSMALGAQLGGAGFTPDKIETAAAVTLAKTDGGFAITKITLTTTATSRVQPRKPSTRPLPTLRQAAPSPSCSPTTLKSFWTRSWSNRQEPKLAGNRQVPGLFFRDIQGGRRDLTPLPRLRNSSCCLFSATRLSSVSCRSGGIGRRAWFRSTYSQGCGGSSPFFGTKNLAFVTEPP